MILLYTLSTSTHASTENFIAAFPWALMLNYGFETVPSAVIGWTYALVANSSSLDLSSGLKRFVLGGLTGVVTGLGLEFFDVVSHPHLLRLFETKPGAAFWLGGLYVSPFLGLFAGSSASLVAGRLTRKQRHSGKVTK